MSRTAAALLGLLALAAPARADNNGIRQSPLLMRRAGPSCRPGDLGGQAGAGYLYRLGPCAGPDADAAPAGSPQRRSRPGARR